MDLGTIGIGFLLGIIGAGFGAVLQQVIVGHFRGEAVRRALLAELEENVALTTKPDVSHLAKVGRSVWDVAKEASLPAAATEALLAAYSAGERYNATIDMLLAKMTNPSNFSIPADQRDITRDAAGVCDLFGKARDALRKV